MRIVYDDAQQEKLVSIFEEFMENLDISTIITGRDFPKIYLPYFGQQNKGALAKGGFEVGKTATHAHGIGNNNCYSVYYKAENELQHCAYQHINFDPFGPVYVYLTDYNNQRISKSYTLHSRSKKVIVKT